MATEGAQKSVSERDFGFTCVRPEEGVVLRWADPKTIRRNDLNPRDHDGDQDEVVGDSIDRHGWLTPLVFNYASGHLVDGHDRLDLAIKKGLDAVPVWVIDVPEDQEAEVIISLHESARLGVWNPARTRALIDRMSSASEAVKAMVDRMAAREGIMERMERDQAEPSRFPSQTEATQDRVNPVQAEPSPTKETPSPSVSASRVRLVQLFLDKDDVERFEEWTDDLQEMWGVSTVTDAVMRTLSDAHLAYLRSGRRRRG